MATNNPFNLQPVPGFKPGPEQALSAANVAQALSGTVPSVPVGQTLNPPPQLAQLAVPPVQPNVPLATGLGNIRVPTNQPREAAIQDIQAALSQQQQPIQQQPAQAATPLSQPAVPLGSPAPVVEPQEPQAQQAAQALTPEQVAPEQPIQASNIKIPNIQQPGQVQAPTEEIPDAQKPTKLQAFGARLAEGLQNPKVQQAMFQAAQALDPQGFGGRLAASGLANLSGQQSQEMVSRLLAGEDISDIQTTLSQPEISQAISDVQSVQAGQRDEAKLAKIESPEQKLFRAVTTARVQGDNQMAVAQTRILGDMQKNIAAIKDKNMRQEVSQAYSAISEIRKTIPLDILSADGTINEKAFLEATLGGGQGIRTDAQKESLKASVEVLEKQGFDTLGMRAYLDRLESESNNQKPTILTNPLASAPPQKVPALNVTDQVRAGNLQDNGDGTFTILKHQDTSNIGQKVKVDANGTLRFL